MEFESKVKNYVESINEIKRIDKEVNELISKINEQGLLVTRSDENVINIEDYFFIAFDLCKFVKAVNSNRGNNKVEDEFMSLLSKHIGIIHEPNSNWGWS